MPDKQLISLRTAVRNNIGTVMGYIDRNYIKRVDGKAIGVMETPICMFCGTTLHITKEHIIPRWIFEKDTIKFFNITLNGHEQTYNKTTISACQKCNTERLNAVERFIQFLFNNIDTKDISFSEEDSEYLIRWLEIIDYKFQVMNITKNFVSSKKGEYVPYLSDFPLYMLLQNKDYSPRKILTEIRSTLKRISVKDKSIHINSLVIFKTTNKGYHFFHTLNEFIFFELPKYGIAFFYFYTKTFKTPKAAFKEAIKVIEKAY